MVLSNVSDTFMKYTEGANLPVTRKPVYESANQRSHKLTHNLYKSLNVFMQNPYTVCRGGAGTENVHIMQQTEGSLDWIWKNKALPDRPADEHDKVVENLEKRHVDRVFELNTHHVRQVYDLNAEIVALKETLKEKNERLKVERATIAALNKENHDLNDLKQISFDQRIEIGRLETQISKFLDKHEYIGTASHA